MDVAFAKDLYVNFILVKRPHFSGKREFTLLSKRE